MSGMHDLLTTKVPYVQVNKLIVSDIELPIGDRDAISLSFLRV